MHIYMMHIHMLLDHVCTMYIHMLLDNDAYVHDAYICDIQSLTMLHVRMMRLKFCDLPTNQPTDKAILGVGLFGKWGALWCFLHTATQLFVNTIILNANIFNANLTISLKPNIFAIVREMGSSLMLPAHCTGFQRCNTFISNANIFNANILQHL